MTADGVLLSEEQRMVRDMARDFAADRLAPHAGAWDLMAASRTYPPPDGNSA